MGAILVAVTFVGYLGAAVVSVMALYEVRREPTAMALAGLGFVSETVWLIQRTVVLGTFPAVTVYDWVAFFSWVTVGLFFVARRRQGMSHVGGFLFPVIFLVWLLSQWYSKTTVHVPVHLTGAWLVIHVAGATLAYAAFVMAAVFGIMYIEKERELKRKQVRLFYYQLPSLGEMDAYGARMITWGVPLLVVALGAGAVWAKVVWGHYWAWSLKDVWSLSTGLVYVFYLVARWLFGWRGHRSAVLAMMAFLLVLANFFGVNLVFHGGHNYNF